MKNILNSILSLFIICGVLLFWYIDWYWVVLSYNIAFSYLSFTIYRDYNDNPRFRNKIPLLFYIGLPLLFNFIGFLISIIKGFEEIPNEEILKRENIKKDVVEKVFKQKKMKSPYLKKFN